MFVATALMLSIVLSACASKPTATPRPKPTESATAAPSPVAKNKIVMWEQEPDNVDVFLDELIANFMTQNNHGLRHLHDLDSICP